MFVREREREREIGEEKERGGIEIEKERNRAREIVKVHKHVSGSVSPLQPSQRYRDGQDW